MPTFAYCIEEVMVFVSEWKQKDLVIVHTQGVFDFLHEGHRNYLNKAAEFGDRLIVGIDSDEKVRNRKGPLRPFEPFLIRAEKILSLPSVDLVYEKLIYFTRWHYIRLIQPGILVIPSGAYSDAERKSLSMLCSRLVSLPRTLNISSSNIVDPNSE